jgi:hypothetical protein
MRERKVSKKPLSKVSKAQLAIFGLGSIANDFKGLRGERDRIRTCDPLIKSQLLYQLSYAPTRAGN